MGNGLLFVESQVNTERQPKTHLPAEGSTSVMDISHTALAYTATFLQYKIKYVLCIPPQQAAAGLPFRLQLLRSVNVYCGWFYGVVSHTEIQGSHFSSEVHAGHRKIYLENFVPWKHAVEIFSTQLTLESVLKNQQKITSCYKKPKAQQVNSMSDIQSV